MMNEDNAKTELRTRRMPFRPAPNSDPGQSVNVLPVGTHLGEFEILGLIGEGGFGIVYLAYDHSLERHVALKEYMPSALATRTHGMAVTVRSRQNADTFTAGLKSFVNEAKMLAQFDSPALVKVHRFWEGNGTAYMVMPFYEGITLKQALKERRVTPTESWIRVLLADLFDAIETIHHAHCLHRDIAPDNILLLKDGRPLLLDFGAARRVIGDLTQCLTVILKPGFAPIEQYADIAGLRQGAWTDIYALAAVVYYLITGKAPPPAVARMVHDELVPARKAGKGRYSDAFLAVLDKALSVKPEQRFRSIDELRRALDIMETVPRTIPGATASWATTMVRTTFMAEPKPQAKPAVQREEQPDIKPAARQQPKPNMKAEPYLDTAPDATPDARPAARQESRPDKKPPPQPAAAPDNGRRYPPQPAHGASGRNARSKQQWLLLGLLLSAGIVTGVYLGTNRPWEESPSVSAPDKGSMAESSGSSGTASRGPQGEAAATAPTASAPSSVAPQSEAPPSTARVAPALPQPEQHAAATARQLSEIEMWRAVSASDEASGYQRYLREYPQGRYATLARIRLERKQPNAAMSTAMGTPSDIAPPPAKQAAKPTPAPDNAVPPQATAQKPASKKEERLWSTATAINDPTVYEAYLRKYPKGRYAPLAKDRLATLNARQAEAPVKSPPAHAAIETPDTAATTSDSPAPAPAGNADRQASIAPPAAPAANTQPPYTPPAPPAPPAEPLPKAAPEPSIARGKKTIKAGDQIMTGDFSADPKTGIVSGTGKVVWANGDQFEGTMVNGRREGKGTFIWRNGQRYSGEWRHDAPNGKGTIVFTDGSRYEGDVKDGVPQGQGVTRFKDGDVYRGGWVRGKSSGQGRYTWANGSYWEGEFRDDKPTENGKMVFGGDPARTIVGAPPPPTNKGPKAARAEAGPGAGY
jgi:hypothetical protein